MSKIEKLKAIHNIFASVSQTIMDVVTMSKIEKLKAIHNGWFVLLNCVARCCDDVKDRKIESHSQLYYFRFLTEIDVVTMSKIEKLKAIHNSARSPNLIS